MFPIQDSLSAATRNNLASQFAMLASLTGKTFESVEKLYRLNLAAAKASMDESSEAVRQLLATREPREFIELSMAQVQPSIEKAIAYSRHVVNITSDTQAEFIQAAESRFDENKRNVAKLVDDLAKNAPAGSQGAVEAIRSVIETTSAGYEQLTRTAKHAVSVASGTLDAAANQVVPTVQTVETAPAANADVIAQ
jgi:phasin family protein